MKLRTQVTAALAALVFLSIATATAVGYTGQVDKSITVSGTPTCEPGPFAVTATVLDGAGAKVVGQSVAWVFVTPPSALDKISPTSSITDSNGEAVTMVTFAEVSGTREIRATTGSVSASAFLSPATCDSDSGSVESAQGTPAPEGLPSTSTLPAESSGGTPIAALFLASICALAGALALRHRVAATRS